MQLQNHVMFVDIPFPNHQRVRLDSRNCCEYPKLTESDAEALWRRALAETPGNFVFARFEAGRWGHERFYRAQ